MCSSKTLLCIYFFFTVFFSVPTCCHPWTGVLLGTTVPVWRWHQQTTTTPVTLEGDGPQSRCLSWVFHSLRDYFRRLQHQWNFNAMRRKVRRNFVVSPATTTAPRRYTPFLPYEEFIRNGGSDGLILRNLGSKGSVFNKLWRFKWFDFQETLNAQMVRFLRSFEGSNGSF